MGRPTMHGISARVVAGLVMGTLTLVLMASATVGLADSSRVGQPLVQLRFPVAAIATVLIVVLSTTARAAWGRLCLTNGIVSVLLAAASLQGRGQPFWPSNPVYQRALDQGMRWWLDRLAWSAAAYSGGAIVAGTVLFALAYCLLRWPRGRHRATP
jgi:uncharacterized membrane protein YkvI